MQPVIAIVLLAFYTVSAGDVATFYPHYTVYKSFPTALKDCADYYEIPDCSLDRIVRTSFPNEPEVRKQIRCALLDLRCWDDATGVHEQAMNFFFNPTPEDSCFLNRTRDCIIKAQIQSGNSSDVDTQAYNAFICYYRQYGNLNDTDQFLRRTPREVDQLVLTSISVASVSNDALVQFSQGNVLDNPEFPSLLLTIYIRGGFYQYGLLREHLYIQYGDPEFLAPQTEQCVDAAVNSLHCYASEKDLLLRIFRNCLQDITDTIDVVQRLSSQLLGSSSNCSEETTTQAPTTSPAPCYNLGPR